MDFDQEKNNFDINTNKMKSEFDIKNKELFNEYTQLMDEKAKIHEKLDKTKIKSITNRNGLRLIFHSGRI